MIYDSVLLYVFLDCFPLTKENKFKLHKIREITHQKYQKFKEYP